jgi:hypothetical protein
MPFMASLGVQGKAKSKRGRHRIFSTLKIRTLKTAREVAGWSGFAEQRKAVRKQTRIGSIRSLLTFIPCSNDICRRRAERQCVA